MGLTAHFEARKHTNEETEITIENNNVSKKIKIEIQDIVLCLPTLEDNFELHEWMQDSIYEKAKLGTSWELAHHEVEELYNASLDFNDELVMFGMSESLLFLMAHHYTVHYVFSESKD